MAAYDSYKDSGVKWLGKVPSHWEIKSLHHFLTPFSMRNHGDKQLLSVTRDKGVITRDAKGEDDNYNVIPEDLSGYKYIMPGDFVINKMKSWQGSYGVSDFEGIVSPAYFTYHLKFPNKRFFSLALRSSAYIPFFMQFSKGIRVNQWDLTPDALKVIPFFLPSEMEQEAIVAYLDNVTAKIDEAIAAQQKMIDALNERKQIIITRAVTKGLNPDAPLRDSGIDWLGQIPAHWEIKKLKMLSEIKGRIGFRGYTNDDLVECGEGAITLSPSNIKNGKMDYSYCSYLSWFKYEESPEIKVQNGHILFVKTGSSYGKTAFVENLPMEATINPQFSLIKPISVNPVFLNYAISSTYFSLQVEKGVIGSTIPTISQNTIKNFIVLLPPIEEQHKIVDSLKVKLNYIDNIISICENKISLLQERKQIIINEVVTGKKKVI